MADEVGNGELARRLDEISLRLDRLVTRSEVDIRLAAITKDIGNVESRLTMAESRRWQGALAVVTSIVFPLFLLYLSGKGVR